MSADAATGGLDFLDYFIGLFAYDRWANRRVLDAMDLLGARTPRRSIDRLAHLLICQKAWNQRMRGDASPETELFPSWTLEQTRDRAEEIFALMESFLASLSRAELLEEFEYRATEGARYRNRRIDILTQLSQHGCYHRGQIATELNPLLEQPLATDYVFFRRRADAEAG